MSEQIKKDQNGKDIDTKKVAENSEDAMMDDIIMDRFLAGS